MRSVSVRLADLCKITIPIGFVGENLHTQVKIDCMKSFEEYPDALVALSVKPAEGDAYPAVVTREGNFIIWDITDSDLVHHGVGEFQLSFIVDQIVAKSYIGKIRVDRSIMPTGDIPDPVENWIGQATELLEEIEDAFPEGGTKGQVLAKASENDFDTEWVDLIDDNAGAGDTDKTWSASKLTSEFSSVQHDVDAKYEKPATGIPASDMAAGVIPDVSGKADKANPVFTGSVSIGRKSGTTVGYASLAQGANVTASGAYSSAQGFESVASGSQSHAEGNNTIAAGWDQHVSGRYNVSENSSYAEIVGNGYAELDPQTFIETVHRSNARALDWNGNERLHGDLYVGCNDDSSGGTKVAKVTELQDMYKKIELMESYIPDTVQTITFDQQTGNISQILHSRNNVAVRTDVFTFGSNSVTEVRTLDTGESLTIDTNTATLVTTVAYTTA